MSAALAPLTAGFIADSDCQPGPQCSAELEFEGPAKPSSQGCDDAKSMQLPLGVL